MLLTKDKIKKEQISTVVLINMINRGEVNLNHPLQRRSGQWKPSKRDELVASIIRGEDIPNIVICQKGIVDYLIDGLQRISTISLYRQDCFRLGKRIEAPEITYRQVVKDKNGEMILDEEGNPKLDIVTFDIRGKKYSDLPDTLKDMVDNYPFCVTKIYNCTDEEIGRHIRRYNNGKAMTSAQSSVTFLSSGLADRIKKLASSHVFFKDITDFSNTIRKNGTIEKIIMESLMTSFHVCDWVRDPGVYLSEVNWRPELESLSGNLTRLANCLTEEATALFTAKDTFLFVGLFSRFAMDHGEDEDYLFNEFLTGFTRGEIENKEWNELNESRGTKDKKCVIGKLECLDTMMNEYLGSIAAISLSDAQRVATCDLFQEILKPEKPLDLVQKCYPNQFIREEDVSEFIECTEIINELSLNCPFDLFRRDFTDLFKIAKKVLENEEYNIEDAVEDLTEVKPESASIVFEDGTTIDVTDSGITDVNESVGIFTQSDSFTKGTGFFSEWSDALNGCLTKPVGQALSQGV